ncbi:hypothetical protein O181_044661 [Austropuccinia psidii MF-1]|uniref:Uncharacterized protein n=1 Tax=Austropuccinia psidii MF-1 TaxID=1389203 RepID=A0A9Q3DIS9_9BASI|nr:hypothetical protein [Austropuccinia psidii MF-1]
MCVKEIDHPNEPIFDLLIFHEISNLSRTTNSNKGSENVGLSDASNPKQKQKHHPKAELAQDQMKAKNIVDQSKERGKIQDATLNYQFVKQGYERICSYVEDESNFNG